MNALENPIEFIASHPELYFPTGKPTGEGLALLLWIQATSVGPDEIWMRRRARARADLWVVAATKNWLRPPAGMSESELFERILQNPGDGPNSMRPEVLVNAFCTHVYAIADGAEVFAKGDELTDIARFATSQAITSTTTLIAFSFPIELG